MSTDIATLGLEVDARPVARARDELGRFTRGAEEAEQGTKKLGRATDLLKNLYGDLAKAYAAWQIASHVKEASLLAARYETMGVVMRVAGNNAGYTNAKMLELQKQLQVTGISMLQSRNALTQLSTANIDLAKAQDLARIAQNLAVVANINSSEALERMIHGIKSGETEVLQTLGLNIKFESSYKSLATQLGINSDKLTEKQKTLARTNAVIQEAISYNGIYEESMSTAGKQISSMSRYIEDLKVKVGQAFLPVLSRQVADLTRALKEANAELDRQGGKDGAMDIIGQAALTMYEKVSRAAVSVLNDASSKFVILGKDLGGLAAAADRILHLDWEGLKNVLQSTSEDTNGIAAANRRFQEGLRGTTVAVEGARKAVHFYSENAAKGAMRASMLAATAEERRIAEAAAARAAAEEQAKSDEAKAEASKKAAQAAEQHRKQFEGLIEAINEKVQTERLATAAAGLGTEAELYKAKILDDVRTGVLKLSATEKARLLVKLEELQLAEQLRLAGEKERELQKDTAEREMKALDAVNARVAAMQLEVDNYGKTTAAINANTIAKLENEIATGDLNDIEVASRQEQIRKLERLTALQGTLEGKKAGTKLLETFNEEVDKVGKTFHDVFTAMLTKGQSGWKAWTRSLRDTFQSTVADAMYTAFAKPFVVNLVGRMSGMVGGAEGIMSTAANAVGTAAGGAAGGGGASTAVSALSAGASIFGAGGLAGSMAAGAGWLTGATTFGGSMAAAGSLAATGTLGGIASSIGMVAGALGPIALAIMAAVAIWKKFDTSGTSHTGGAAIADSSGARVIRAESIGFAHTKTTAEAEKFVMGLASGVTSILDSTALAFGKTAGYTAATAFADDTSKDGAWGSLVIQKAGSTVVDWNNSRNAGSWAPKEFKDGEAGQKQYLEAMTASVRTALDAIGLPDWAKKMLDSMGKGQTIEDLAKVVDQINRTQKALVDMKNNLPGFANMTDAAVSALMAASGGIDALASSATAYFANFMTKGEQSAAAMKQVSDALAAVGVQMPANREAFRAEVEARMAMGEAAAPALAKLFQVAGAFAQLHPEVETTTSRLKTEAEARDDLARAYEREADAIKDTIDRMDGLARGMRSFINDQRLGNLSTLTPEEKYAEAKRQFEEISAAALGGDTKAQDRFQDAHTAFLSASQLVNASSSRYAADFEKAQADAEALAAWAEGQLTASERAQQSLDESVKGLLEVRDGVLSVREAIDQLRGILAPAQAGSSITKSYQELLGRAPDEAGLQFWKDQMTRGVTADQVRDAIQSSQEYTSRTNSGTMANNPVAAAMQPVVEALNNVQAEVAGLRTDQQAQTGDTLTALDGANSQVAAAVAVIPDAIARSQRWNTKLEMQLE
jgi:hypothetical protein